MCLAAITEWIAPPVDNKFFAITLQAGLSAQQFLKSNYSYSILIFTFFYSYIRNPMKLTDIRKELTDLLMSVKAMKYGSMLEEPKNKKLEPIYLVLSYLVTAYLLIKIPVLLLLAYASQWRFYPYDFLEHWSSSGFGITFSIIFTILFGSIACFIGAPAIIAERQKFIGRRTATPYFIWAIFAFPVMYLYFIASENSVQSLAIFIVICLIFTAQVTSILYQPSFKRARNGIFGFLFVSMFAVYYKDIPACVSSMVLEKLGVGCYIPVKIRIKEFPAALPVDQIAITTIDARLILLGPTTIYYQDSEGGVKLIERQNAEVIHVRNVPNP